MQGESADNSCYNYANVDVGQTEDQMDDATVGALANLATSTAADRGVVANVRLARQLEKSSKGVKEVNALLKRRVLKEEGRYPSYIPWKTIVGIMASTRLQRATPARVAISPSMGTRLIQQKLTTWVGARQTKNNM
jgi:hypothetical protein